MFLKNAWYVAAWDTEVAAGRMLARTLLGEPVILYRTTDGAVVALEDRCCHRAAPLSLGTVVGDNVRCGYHGLTFAPDGSLIHIPTQTQVPPGAGVRAYPIIERWQFVWIWMGEPAKADPGLIPNWWWMDHPDWSVSRGDVFHIACNYELITDNLLDLAHVPFLHPGSIGTDYIIDFPIKTERLERSVKMTRLMTDVPQAPFHRRVKAYDTHVDRWTRVEVFAPAHVLVNSGNAPTGTGGLEGKANDVVNLQSPNEVTPETEGSSFLFYGHARNFHLGNETTTQRIRNEMLKIYREDIDMMEGQQRRMAREPDRALLAINQDAPVVAMRRVVRQLIEAERAR